MSKFKNGIVSDWEYDFTINNLKDKIYMIRSFLRKKMPQNKRDGLKGLIVELKSAIKRLGG